MAIDFDIEIEGDVLRAVARGQDDDQDGAQAYGNAIIQACHVHNIRNGVST